MPPVQGRCGWGEVPGVGCVAAAKLALEVEEVPDGDDAAGRQVPGGEKEVTSPVMLGQAPCEGVAVRRRVS